MDLLHPSIDLTLEPKAPRSRELLEHRFTESGSQSVSAFHPIGRVILMDIDIVIASVLLARFA